jgi:DNA-binding transcriptional MerR regulator
MSKINLLGTLQRIRKVRRVLLENDKGLYQKEICRLTNICSSTLSELIYNFFRRKISITKIGKNKLFRLMDKSPSDKEIHLIKRENALEKAKRLRENGFSHSEIKEILKKEFGFAVRDSFIRNIKMNKNGLERYKDKIKKDRKKAGVKGGKVHVTTGHIYKIQSLRMQGYLKKIMSRIPESSKNLTSLKVRILAHCLFDGFIEDIISQHYYVVGYCNTSEILLNQFIEDTKNVYGLEPADITKRKNNNKIVRYFSKAVVKDLEKYLCFENGEEKLKNEIVENIPAEWKIEFLRAFWDDEGMVGFKEKKRCKDGCLRTYRFIEAFQKNIKLLKQIKTMHKSLGIKTRINKNKIIISDKVNLKKFAEIIGFSPGVISCRSTSKWYGIEKNKILQMAIESYGK